MNRARARLRDEAVLGDDGEAVAPRRDGDELALHASGSSGMRTQTL